jgi:hypothetical protein
VTVCLIACSKLKAAKPCRARDLYKGNLFKLSVRYAEEVLRCRWAVLSSKHGVVQPRQLIAPYRSTISNHPGATKNEAPGALLTEEQVREWALRTNQQLRELFPDAHFICLLSKPYMRALAGLDAENPLDGMKLGPRMAWLINELEGHNATAAAARSRKLDD